MSSYLPFVQVVEEIQQQSRSGATGSLFISTDHNRSAHLIFEDGEIVYIYYFNLHGVEALDAMADITHARFQFQPGMTTEQRVPLPPTAEIINALAAQLPEGTQLEEHTPAPAIELSDDSKERIEQCLAEYIGPVAAFICEDSLDNAPDLETAIERMLAEFPSAEEADQCRAELINLLGL